MDVKLATDVIFAAAAGHGSPLNRDVAESIARQLIRPDVQAVALPPPGVIAQTRRQRYEE